MTLGELIGVISALISITAVVITLTRNKTDYVNRKLDWELKQENRITSLEQTLKGLTPINDRVVAIETKIGLFWHMIEQMPLKDYIKTTPQDLIDAAIYDRLRGESPTPVLVRLGKYLLDEIPVRMPDERAFLILKLGAIQAQLADRGIVLSYGSNTT